MSMCTPRGDDIMTHRTAGVLQNLTSSNILVYYYFLPVQHAIDMQWHFTMNARVSSDRFL